MNALMQNAERVINTNPWLAFLLVFVGGLMTASNPCVLAMIPLMIGFVGGTRELTGVKKALVFSFFFVIGLSVSFSILGIIAATTGRLLGDVGSFWRYVVAAVCFLMGIYLLEIFKIPLPAVTPKNFKAGGLVGALLMGMLFGIVSTPCAVPILAVILVLIAAKGSVVYGLGLLFTYGLGHCTLIVVAGTSVGLAKNLLESRHLQKANFYLRKAAAVLIIFVGIYFLAFK
ncbi:MAG TPA: cytochrome c biogenesis protein CcdA [bacterium]